jgi:hypothetical protein
MNEAARPAKSAWPRRLFWTVITAVFAAFAIIFGALFLGHVAGAWPLVISYYALVAVGPVLLACLFVPKLRALAGAQELRRGFFLYICAVTLLASYYAEENLRGRKTWLETKRELEGKGMVIDWAPIAPPPVPDDQNVFKAPKIQEWFVGRATNELNRLLDIGLPPQRGSTNQLILELTAAAPGQRDPRQFDAEWHLDSSSATSEAAALLEKALGPHFIGARRELAFLSHADGAIKPMRVLLTAEKIPTANQIASIFPGSLATNQNWTPVVYVNSSGNGSFRVTLASAPCAAVDYLAHTEGLEKSFDVVREAVKRPCDRMDGNYAMPAYVPVPNFVNLRSIAQTLSQRVQCNLLLGRPEAAMRDLTLMHDLRRLLECKPSSRPITLVAAMINVAIRGLYASTVADGLRLHAWKEPQLIAIEEQLKDIYLPDELEKSLRFECAAVCRTLDASSPYELAQLYGFWDKKPPMEFLLLMHMLPRGWIYQNMAFSARSREGEFATITADQHLVVPHLIDTFMKERVAEMEHFSPYTFTAAVSLPNLSKAWQRTTYQQTLVSQARIACALERYHFAHGEFPETLASLAPQFLPAIPRDLVGGEPLKYRRTDGKFILYSIGWNERDDNGASPHNSDLSAVAPDGDWVWPPGDF